MSHVAVSALLPYLVFTPFPWPRSPRSTVLCSTARRPMLPAVLLAAVVVGCQGANFFHFLFFFFLICGFIADSLSIT